MPQDSVFSSPIKPLRPNHAAHVRHEVQTFVVPDHEQELTVAEFWKELDYKPKDFKQYHLSDSWCPKKDFQKYMNDISERIFASFPDLGAYLSKSSIV